jgi:hypothetical protein
MLTEIITSSDLQLFKTDLIETIKQLLKENNGQPSKKWLKSCEVRKILDISAGTLQNMRLNGSLPFTKIGGVIYYDYADILEMLQTNKKRPAISFPGR